MQQIADELFAVAPGPRLKVRVRDIPASEGVPGLLSSDGTIVVDRHYASQFRKDWVGATVAHEIAHARLGHVPSDDPDIQEAQELAANEEAMQYWRRLGRPCDTWVSLGAAAVAQSEHLPPGQLDRARLRIQRACLLQARVLCAGAVRRRE